MRVNRTGLIYALTAWAMALQMAIASPVEQWSSPQPSASTTPNYQYGDQTGNPPSTNPPGTNGSVASNGNINLPAACSKVNGIGVGWLPGEGTTLSAITSSLGGTPSCFDGQYAQITEYGAYTDSSNQLLGKMGDIQNPAATIFIASIMPTIPMNKVDSTVAGGIANVLKQFTDKGIEVWLRYGHEMNYYSRSDSEGGHYNGNAPDFKQSWAAVSAAVKSNPKIKMFWSPNGYPDDYDQWYPDSGQVDMVGIDVYPDDGKTFSDVYKTFCQKYSKLPFVIGETGAGPSYKSGWLQQLVSPEAKTACPNYVGFSWFEYDKEKDFRVASGGQSLAKSILGRRRRM